MGIISHVLGPAAPEIIMNSTIPIMQYIELSLLDESVALRQSAFAIVGDFAAVAYPNIKHHLNPIMKSILLQVEKSPSDEIPVTNNAIWATGEIALKSRKSFSHVRILLEGDINRIHIEKEDFGEWIDIMARIIILILNRESSADMIKRNAAVSLGRMCLIYPTEMSNFLPYFLNSW